MGLRGFNPISLIFKEEKGVGKSRLEVKEIFKNTWDFRESLDNLHKKVAEYSDK